MEEEQGLNRGEVVAILGALADLRFDVEEIPWYIRGDDDDWEEMEEEEDPTRDD